MSASTVARHLAPALAVLLCLPAVAGSQRTPDSTGVEWRIQNVAGVSPAAAKAFLRELQANLAAGRRAQVCGAVRYPLLHQAKGNVHGPVECLQQFDAIFTPRVVRTVASQKFADLFVNSAGIMIGDGDVWFARECLDNSCRRTTIRVIAVNHLEELQQPLAKGSILFSCRADGQRIEAQADGRGGVTLQLWKPGRPSSASPDLFVPSGSYEAEGSAGCSRGIWKFERDQVQYELSELGCLPERPPKGALGQFSQRVRGAAQPVTWWCY